MSEIPASAYGPGGRPPSRPGTVTGEPQERPTCWRCKRTLAEVLTPPWSVRCPRCKSQNRSPQH